MRRPKLDDESSESVESSEETSELSIGRVSAGGGTSVSSSDRISRGRDDGVVGAGVESTGGEVLTASAKEEGAGWRVGAVEKACVIGCEDECTSTS